MPFDLVAHHDVNETPDYKLEIDEFRDPEGQQRLMLHLDVRQWSDEALERMHGAWSSFRKCVTAPLYACPRYPSDRWHELATRLGWKCVATVPCNDGVTRPLWIHTVEAAI